MKRKAVGGEENDVHSRWRHVMCVFGHAGVASKAKRRSRRRERHEAKIHIRKER